MIGVLVTNLGTPDAPTPSALRRYLAEFLWDPRVVEIPRPLWWLILNGIVLRVRPKKSAQLYQKIWTPEGSPLLVNSRKLVNKLQNKISAETFTSTSMSTGSRLPSRDDEGLFKVVLGMRYGNPSIKDALEELKQHNVEQIIVLPLFPQYSAATTAATFDAVTETIKTWRYIPSIKFISHYFDHTGYIDIVADSIRAQYNSNHHLVFSFHGLPKRCVELGDPYQQQCQTTAKLIAEKLQLSSEQYTVAFQSRFGYAEWLQPYCDETLRALPQKGIKHISVVCPGFAVDCLETLEEIAQQNREIFLNAGGESFNYIPALNANDKHIEFLTQLIVE